MKRTLSLLMALLLVVLFTFSDPTAVSATAPTEAEAYQAMIALKSEYPEGMPWEGDRFYPWNGGIYHGGYGCVAFAFILSDAAFGSLPARMTYDVKFSEVRPGDILRMDNDTHTVIVLQVFSDHVVIAEGSFNNSVHWGRILTVEEVESSDNMMTRYPDDSDGPVVDPNFPEVPIEGILGSGSCGDYGLPNVKWTLASTGELFIYGHGKMDTYTTKTPWSSFANKITSVTFLGELTYISPYGFCNLPNLRTVTLCDSVEEIGVNAFAGCRSLSSVTMGSKVKKIYSYAFIGCTALTSIVLPGSLQSLSNNAFAQSGLKQIVLPEGLTYLGNNAFEECDSLTTAYIPGTITNNFQYVFYACDQLRDVTMGEGLKEIGRYSFAECTSLQSVIFPTTLKEIGDNTFSNSGLLSATLPKGLTTLCEQAFYCCEKLKSVSIPSTVTTFENSVFAYCKALETVTIEDGIPAIGNSAFRYCESLKSITLPGSISEIKPYTFYNAAFESIVIPEGVTTIGVDAFAYCKKLTTVTFPSTLKTLKSTVFDRCDSLWLVYYYGSEAQWNAVNVDSSNYVLNNALFEFIDPNACRHPESVTIPAVSPQCEEPGWTAGKKCANADCGKILEQPGYISPTGHSWKAATCTTAKTCRTCGQTQGNPNGHNWKAATCTTAKTCLSCSLTQGNPNGHSWKAATCTAPKTCKVCSVTDGNPNGHNWKAATCTAPKTCKVCSAIEGKPNGHTSDGVTDCGKESKCTVCKTVIRGKGEHAWAVREILSPADCVNSGTALYYCQGCLITAERELPATGHEWSAPTCTAPKTCDVCSATEGEPIGHLWIDATCTTAKICTACAATEGEPAGHDWQDATCQSAKLCLTCLMTEGDPAPHADGNADDECDNCGETLSDTPTTPDEEPTEPSEETTEPSQEPATTQPTEPTDAPVPEATPTQPAAPEAPSDEEGKLPILPFCIGAAVLIVIAVTLCILLRKKRTA